MHEVKPFGHPQQRHYLVPIRPLFIRPCKILSAKRLLNRGRPEAMVVSLYVTGSCVMEGARPANE